MSNSRIRHLSAALLVLPAVWLGGKYLLPLAMPFLLGFLLSLAAEPGVRLLHRKFRLGRGLASFLGVTGALVLLSALGMLLISLLVKELGRLAGILPNLEQTARQGLTSLEDWLLGLAMAAPEGIRSLLTRSVLGLFDSGNDLYGRAISQLPTIATGFLSHVPDSFLALGTGLLSSYLFSSRLPLLRAWFRQRFPGDWRDRWLPAAQKLKDAVLGWLQAQCKLMVLTFAIVCAGLLLMRISFAPVWALLIALVDAVPMLGTGLILAPWSLILFLEGDSVRALGMLGLFAAATLTRSMLEPRLLGKELGLDPLVTLAAMYLGYQLFGIIGLLISPILAVAIVQLLKSAPTEDKL